MHFLLVVCGCGVTSFPPARSSCLEDRGRTVNNDAIPCGLTVTHGWATITCVPNETDLHHGNPLTVMIFNNVLKPLEHVGYNVSVLRHIVHDLCNTLASQLIHRSLCKAKEVPFTNNKSIKSLRYRMGETAV